MSESDTGATTLDDESDEEVSKGSKAGRKHKGSKGALPLGWPIWANHDLGKPLVSLL